MTLAIKKEERKKISGVFKIVNIFTRYIHNISLHSQCREINFLYIWHHICNSSALIILLLFVSTRRRHVSVWLFVIIFLLPFPIFPLCPFIPLLLKTYSIYVLLSLTLLHVCDLFLQFNSMYWGAWHSQYCDFFPKYFLLTFKKCYIKTEPGNLHMTRWSYSARRYLSRALVILL